MKKVESMREINFESASYYQFKLSHEMLHVSHISSTTLVCQINV